MAMLVLAGVMAVFCHGWPLFRHHGNVASYCDASGACLASARVVKIEEHGAACTFTVVRTYSEGGETVPGKPLTIRTGCDPSTVWVGSVVYVDRTGDGVGMLTGEYPWSR